MREDMIVKILGLSDLNLLTHHTAPGLFDRPIDRELAREFLSDPRHLIAAAVELGTIVGFASAVHYVHPDKPPQLWINEVAVAASYRNQGVAKLLLNLLLSHARSLNCSEAWVLTDRSNAAANRVYSSLAGADAPKEQMMYTVNLNRLDSDGSPP